MITIWNMTIPEFSPEEERRVYIYLPTSYNYNSEQRYPVLYMFDGHNVFFDSDATYGKSWGLGDYLDRNDIPLIVVAVECNHSPDHGRLREYSPFNFQDPKFGKIEGKGKETMEWLIHTLKKEIDHDFRTLPDRQNTYIAGSSMGGLMSLYAALEYNSVFGRAASLSPSIWTNMTKINQLIKTAEIDSDTIIYLDYGSREINFHSCMRKQFKRTTDLLLDRNIYLTSRIVPLGNHCEACWEKQIPFFISTLMYTPS